MARGIKDKNPTYAKKLFIEECEKKKITRKEGAQKLGILPCFLNKVLAHKNPISSDLSEKLADFLKKDLNIVRIMFGIYPKWFISLSQRDPERIYKEIQRIRIKCEKKK